MGPREKKGKTNMPIIEDKTIDRSRHLAAAGLGGTENSSILDKRFKDIEINSNISPSTNVTG